MSLIPWCNLFSTASKYNVTVKKSRYQTIVYVGVVVVFVLLLLTFFTYAYHLVLTLAVIGIVLLGFLLTKQSRSQDAITAFKLTSQGQCSFAGNNHYQLHLNSRCSFLGCWLVLQPVVTVNSLSEQRQAAKTGSETKLLFIYRDSLSKQDFSRISQVITHLHHQS